MTEKNRYTDQDGNQISDRYKIIAGLTLISFICICVTLIAALWPDRIPPSNDNYQTYCRIELFKVRVISISNVDLDKLNQSSLYLSRSVDNSIKGRPSLPIEKKPDSLKNQNKNQTSKPKNVKEEYNEKVAEILLKANAAMIAEKTQLNKKDSCCCTSSATAGGLGVKHQAGIASDLINPKEFEKLSSLNLLFLLLVMIGGFLGNLIHITSSLTNYIGSGQFKRSWWLWYFAKPFVASGLSLAVYFALCGGFLSINNSANNINIVGVMIISILSGLFTDRTTLKLKEVFEVLLRPKEDRSDQLIGEPKVTNVDPLVIVRNVPTLITISGENFTKENLILTIGDQPVDITVTPTKISFTYTIPSILTNQNDAILILRTTKGVNLVQKQLIFM